VHGLPVRNHPHSKSADLNVVKYWKAVIHWRAARTADERRIVRIGAHSVWIDADRAPRVGIVFSHRVERSS
jgi:hypothetical protein